MKLGLFGCGGIGVEFLHSIRHSNIAHLTLVDFDTVEHSNLARQFIFTPDDISHSKAHACARFASQFCPSITIYDTTLQSLPYSAFFNFDIAIAALDNFQARKHLQMRCFGAKIHLIDAGTAGLNGSIRTFLKRIPTQLTPNNACHNCFSRVETAIPVCTLRAKPETINHCVQFALAVGAGMAGNGEFSELSGKDFSVVLTDIFKYEFDNLGVKNDEIGRWIETAMKFKVTLQFFDRESVTDLAFVAAVSRLRAAQFGIKMTISDMEIQSIAGRIIPAVCFANGVVGALAAKAAVGLDLAREREQRSENEQKEVENSFLLIGKSTPYLRRDEIGEAVWSCQCCGNDTFQVKIDEIEVFLQENGYGKYVIYEDEKCLFQSEKEDDMWFDEDVVQESFNFEIGQFLTIISVGKPKINIIVSGDETQMYWKGQQKPVEMVDLDDGNSFSVD